MMRAAPNDVHAQQAAMHAHVSASIVAMAAPRRDTFACTRQCCDWVSTSDEDGHCPVCGTFTVERVA